MYDTLDAFLIIEKFVVEIVPGVSYRDEFPYEGVKDCDPTFQRGVGIVQIQLHHSASSRVSLKICCMQDIPLGGRACLGLISIVGSVPAGPSTCGCRASGAVSAV